MERLTGHFELDVRTLDALLGVERYCYDRPRPRRGRPPLPSVCRGRLRRRRGARAHDRLLARPALHRRRRRRADLHRPLCDPSARSTPKQISGRRPPPCSSAKTLLPRRGLRRMYPHRREELPLPRRGGAVSARCCAARTTASSKRSCRTRALLRRRIARRS